MTSTLTTPLTTSGGTGQSGSGTGRTPTNPASPTKPPGGGSKHPGKHGHPIAHSHKTSPAVHGHGLVKQGHSAAKKLKAAEYCKDARTP